MRRQKEHEEYTKNGCERKRKRIRKRRKEKKTQGIQEERT